MADRRGAYRILVGGNLMESDHKEDLGVEGRIKLKWLCKRWEREAWTGLIWLRIGTVGALF